MLDRWLGNEARVTGFCAALSALALALSLSGVFTGKPGFDVAWAAIVLCGTPILVGACRGLIVDRNVKADVLVAMALVASVATREYFAAGEVALIMQIGSLLEDYASDKAASGIEKLIRLTPRGAHVLRGEEREDVPAEQIHPGDRVVVLAGEAVPVDGVIVEGQTAIDQSVMTGESLPVDKKPGDRVGSGTVNQFGAFVMICEKASADSSLQRMIRLTEEAQANKAPIVATADRWATWLVAVALFCAGAAWFFTGEFMRAVTVLVVFCPCAFILATPTAVVAGIGNAAKYGIIVRSGEALERLSRIRRAAFDKTGTLTCGKPQVAAAVSCRDNFADSDVLHLAAAAEQRSEHPLGRAILAGADGSVAAAEDFRVVPGQGVSATVENKRVLVGKADFMKSQGVDISAADAPAREWMRRGATVVYLASDGQLAGFIALADALRPDAPRAVQKLKAAGVAPMLLTGDNEAAARRIAAKAGIEDVKADLLPEGKMNAIYACSRGGEPVCMIGDGVNDAPAMTAADAGIAMGGVGSDIAIESADAVLVLDDIKRIPYLFSLTQKVMRKIRVNIAASMVINVSAVVLPALGVLTPVTGALWHNFGSVFVVVNAALLLRVRDDSE
ncbi:cation-translocating P-type ATPase [Pyramidobacter sp. SM-530-WT-4B]|uniref:Cation-translocating P-type ATPase n=1 Tax=Pyramidobacter porci TaxID=2605789 RepID=A0A6L5YB30_9BACT|nr:cation-translocating P-type ATPase [Pyramidobacter porci]MST55469.1 cation-translocating P-type ATPase [Pyramidobacter porci]